MKWLNLSGLAYFWGRIQTALSKKVDAEMIGQPGGAAGLDAGGKVPAEQLPEMNYVPATRKVNNKALSADITLTASDVNAVPTTRKVNGKALIADITLTAADVGASGKRVARFTVGTSTAGWTAADCDYLCDGTADQEEINAAITALPATGGEVVILDGTYNITAKIDVTQDNVSIRGNGNATILKRMFNSSVAEGVITLTGRSGCKIANLQIDGNTTSYTNFNNRGIFLSSSNGNTVTGNTCNNSNGGGILSSSSNNNTVTGNTCNSNSTGIFLDSSSTNTVTGNTCNSNGSGIRLEFSSNKNTVTGNTCNSNGSGIRLDFASNNTITGNTCIRGDGLSGEYTEMQHTMRLAGANNSYNLISSNNCMGKAVTNEGGTGNTLVNNKFDAT